jgi:hypothetical protein
MVVATFFESTAGSSFVGVTEVDAGVGAGDGSGVLTYTWEGVFWGTILADADCNAAKEVAESEEDNGAPEGILPESTFLDTNSVIKA